MADILLDLFIQVEPARVFNAINTAAGLDSWWTKRSARTDSPEGVEYELWFGPEYDWRARVVSEVTEREFTLVMTRADVDWTGTTVRFELDARDGGTWVRFAHLGWPSINEHFRISSYCWAAYLRILRRSLEYGEMVGYEERLRV